MTQTKQAPAVKEKSISERFMDMVVREFKDLAGGNGLQLTPVQKRLAQHLFISIDHALQSFEKKRLATNQKDKAPFEWSNVNLAKLATDAIHRINLGLDALIPNHISPIPYFNGKEKKYDLDLRVGYVGKDYYRRKMALYEPMDIFYELVYSNDNFTPLKKSIKNEIESYEFEIKEPFNRGNIIGGFGYVMYEDSRKNKLVIVSEAAFKKAEKNAKSSNFWKDYPIEMRYKTLVHRVTDKLAVDPEKINESYAIVEEDDMETKLLEDIDANANREPIDIQPDPEPEPQSEQGKDEEPQDEEPKKDRNPKQQPLPQPDNGGPGF